jgi:hypothetical protein
VTSLTYTTVYPPAPPSRLADLEEQLGTRLPDTYRAYLTRQDGGALEGYNNHGLEIVTGIGEVPRWSSLWCLLEQDGDVIPAGWIPVGADAGGGLFLLVVTGEARGSVWYQSSELEEDDEGVTTPVVRERLADSWDDFLASIRPLAS